MHCVRICVCVCVFLCMCACMHACIRCANTNVHASANSSSEGEHRLDLRLQCVEAEAASSITRLQKRLLLAKAVYHSQAKIRPICVQLACEAHCLISVALTNRDSLAANYWYVYEVSLSFRSLSCLPRRHGRAVLQVGLM